MKHTINVEATFAFDIEADSMEQAASKATKKLRENQLGFDLRCLFDKFDGLYVMVSGDEGQWDMHVDGERVGGDTL